MYSSYITIAWRNLSKNARFSVINIAGLTIGIAATLFILLWVYTERSWDKHITGYKNIYHVYCNRNFNGEINTGSDMMYPLADAAMQALPEVQAATVVDFGAFTLFTVGEKKLRKFSLHASPRFFDIFNADFIEGDASVLKDPGAVVLTASTAKALFGPGNVVGRTVLVNTDRSLTVKAVVADVPAASTVLYDAIIPFNPWAPGVVNASTDWVNCGNRVFYKTAEGADIAALEKKTIQLVRSKVRDENPTTRGSVILHPMAKWRLYEEFAGGVNTGGRIAYVKLFTWIAIVILLIACVNFMNLSTARSQQRAKEVGVRKSLGSGRRALIVQFLSESLLLASLSCLLAVAVVLLARPAFEQLLNMQLVMPFKDPGAYLLLGGIVVVTGLVAGSYPAMYLSAFNPIKVLKGLHTPGRSALLPRHILVTLQFTVSITLISASLLIYRQIQYVKARDLGYDTNNLLMVQSNPELHRNYIAFENSLVNAGVAGSMTTTSAPITELFGFTSGVSVPGAATQANPVLAFFFASGKLAQTTGVKILEGRDFKTGDSNTVVFNKAALDLLAIPNPVGRKINWAGRERTIVGIVDNMVMGSPYEKPTPVMITYEANWSDQVIIRLRNGIQPAQALTAIGKSFQSNSPSYPFEYRFTDDAFNTKFANEQLLGKLALLFTAFAIFISCLGLFGLVSFSIERRHKEIGIRKVLGASSNQLLYLMSREFMRLVGIAFAIAVPVAWWGLGEWLNNYAYRTSINPLLFLAVGAIMLIIALATVAFNARQAALHTPVKSLRTE